MAPKTGKTKPHKAKAEKKKKEEKGEYLIFPFVIHFYSVCLSFFCLFGSLDTEGK